MIKKTVKRIFSSELGKGAFILFISMNFFHFLNLVFHLTMGRMLGPEGYGVFAVLISFAYFFSIPSESMQTLISKHTSKFNVNKEYGKMNCLFTKAQKKGFFISFVIFVFLTVLGIFLSSFLNIDFWLIFLTNILIFVFFSLPTNLGLLLGRKKFLQMGIIFMTEGLFKIIFSVSFVIFGFYVYGAIGGFMLGLLSSLVFSFYFNREIIHTKKEEVSFDGTYAQSIPYFISMFIIFSFISIDIVLAKRFFSAEMAGQYAVLAMFGKMIFLGTMGIGKAMFPLTSEKHEKDGNASNLFKKSFFAVMGICLIAIFIYSAVPKLLVLILFGEQYLMISPYLIYVGIGFGFLSLTNLNLIYGLSTKGIRACWGLVLFLIIEIILFYLFHSSILEYILSFMVSTIIMFIGSFFFVKR